jgi:hypothetical protein
MKKHSSGCFHYSEGDLSSEREQKKFRSVCHSRRDVLRFYAARVLEYLQDAIMRLDQLRTTKTAPPVAARISALDEPPKKGPIVVN